MQRGREGIAFDSSVKWRLDQMIPAKRKTLMVALGLGAAVVACGAAMLPLLARPTNCGGNSAALGACKNIALNLVLAATEREGTAVSVTNLTSEEREYFRHISGISWLGTATVFATREPVNADKQPRQLIAVCNKAYDNVPQRRFGNAPFTHAVAYGDGSSGLISVEEFRELDLSRFIDAKTLAPTNSATTRSAPLERNF
ncbi:MAG TPA: hypothetical protein VK530_08770 [Candidatus Acidoferrum sp.]|nr:hypothetical protein [Candidatus Acidoferrum sp.]